MEMAHYKVGTSTIAIASTMEGIFKSIIYDSVKGILYSTKKPLELIKELCLEYDISYEGRRESVIYHLGYKKKTPIPISCIDSLYVFPTESPEKYECVWLFFQHIKYLRDTYPKDPKKTRVVFHNQTELIINAPKRFIQSQMEKVTTCICRCSQCGKFSYDFTQQSTNSTFYHLHSEPTTPHLPFIAESKDYYKIRHEKES